MVGKTGGWQANVEYFEDYVVKTPKTEEEIRERVFSYLSTKDKLDELEDRVRKMQSDWKEGLRIISEKNIPSEMLGFPEFLPGGKIKQRRVRVLQDVYSELYEEGKNKEIDRIIGKNLEFIVELWRYGVHEKTGKFHYEFGLLGNKIILIDFGEITDDYETAKKQIGKRYWEKNIIKHIPQEVAEMFNDRAKKVLTLERLKEEWGKNAKV